MRLTKNDTLLAFEPRNTRRPLLGRMTDPTSGSNDPPGIHIYRVTLGANTIYQAAFRVCWGRVGVEIAEETGSAYGFRCDRSGALQGLVTAGGESLFRPPLFCATAEPADNTDGGVHGRRRSGSIPLGRSDIYCSRFCFARDGRDQQQLDHLSRGERGLPGTSFKTQGTHVSHHRGEIS